MEEKNILNITLKNTKDELEAALSDSKKLSEICLEKEEKLSEILNELSTATMKIEELSNIEGKYNETLKIIEDMEVEKQESLEFLASKDLKIKELDMLDKKYTECLKTIEELDKCLQSKTEHLKMKEMRIEELCAVEEKYAEAKKRIQELESDIEYKKEILLSKDLKIEELNNAEGKYCESVGKVTELEKDIQQKLELLTTKDKMIEDLNAKLNKNSMKLDQLEYENIEMKDNIIAERESVKVCLECEIMKDKIKGFEDLNKVLNETQQELENQRQRAERTLKNLNETEDNFDNMVIKKQREINQCNDSIQRLQLELRVLNVEKNRDTEKLRKENERLQMKIEELTLQNTGDFQTIRAENEKLKNDIEILKEKMPMADFAETTPLKIINQNGLKKGFDNIVSGMQQEGTLRTKENEKSPFHLRGKHGEKMEADSSHDDDVILTGEVKDSANRKKLCKEENKKIASVQKSKNVSSSSEKRKRAWDTESSGSECLELVFDKDAKKLMGFASKNKTPNATSSQDRRAKRDILTVTNEETPNRSQNIKSRTTLSFTTKCSPMVKKPLKTDVSDCGDFLSSKHKQENFQASPWLQKTMGTPTTPSQRRFFKTPLKERDFSFKKPQLQNMWF